MPSARVCQLISTKVVNYEQLCMVICLINYRHMPSQSGYQGMGAFSTQYGAFPSPELNPWHPTRRGSYRPKTYFRGQFFDFLAKFDVFVLPVGNIFPFEYEYVHKYIF